MQGIPTVHRTNTAEVGVEAGMSRKKSLGTVAIAVERERSEGSRLLAVFCLRALIKLMFLKYILFSSFNFLNGFFLKKKLTDFYFLDFIV